MIEIRIPGRKETINPKGGTMRMTRAIIIFVAGALLLGFAVAQAQEAPEAMDVSEPVPIDWQELYLQLNVEAQAQSVEVLALRQEVAMLKQTLASLYQALGKPRIDGATRELAEYRKRRAEKAEEVKE